MDSQWVMSFRRLPGRIGWPPLAVGGAEKSSLPVVVGAGEIVRDTAGKMRPGAAASPRGETFFFSCRPMIPPRLTYLGRPLRSGCQSHPSGNGMSHENYIPLSVILEFRIVNRLPIA